MPVSSENLIKISVSFRRSDMRKLHALTEEFARQGLPVRRGTVLRAVIAPSDVETIRSPRGHHPSPSVMWEDLYPPGRISSTQ